MTLTLETLKQMAPVLAALKPYATPKVIGWTLGPLVVGGIGYKLYNTKPIVKMRSKVAAGIMHVTANAIHQCDMLLAAMDKKTKMKPAAVRSASKKTNRAK